MHADTILMVDDSPALLTLYRQYLAHEPYRLCEAESGAQALQLLDSLKPQAVLLDLNLPDMNGLEILRHINEHNLPIAVVVISGYGSVDVAVEAMRWGAFDFIEKPFSPERLLITVRNALEKQHLANLLEAYEAHERSSYEGFIGQSLPMQALYRTIDSVAGSKATVFIVGESGTGKELCAEAIHHRSPRRDKPFVAINCAAIPHELMESEIFGHVKGAFTGANSHRIGAAQRAHGGTLFLDEICEMDLNLQTKLLRFIQTGTFSKVGSDTQEKVDIRIICATNRDPLAEVESGRFREDLYYRLHVVPIHLPPLRERGRDILLIAQAFLAEFSREERKAFRTFAPETEQILRRYTWPGNVRELQNVIRNVVVMHRGEVVTPEMLPRNLREMKPAPPGRQADDDAHNNDECYGNIPAIQPLWVVEKQAITEAIKKCHGNIPKAAVLLEVSPSTIYRKLRQWGERPTA